MLFAKIVPNCKKLGLLDAPTAGCATRFTELGVIEFEDWVDTSEEYGPRSPSIRTPPRSPPSSPNTAGGPGPRWEVERLAVARFVTLTPMTGRFGAVVTAMVTPFDDDGALDLDAAA